MKRSKEFLLEEGKDTMYLLPYGQKIADHVHGMRLNESSCFLLKLLEKEMSEEQMFDALKEYYDIGEKDYEEVRKDLREGLHMLKMTGAVEDGEEEIQEAQYMSGEPFTYKIGPLAFSLYAPQELIPEAFLDFAQEKEEKAGQQIRILPGAPLFHENGRVLLRNEEVLIMENASSYIFLFLQQAELYEMHVKKDGGKVSLYCAAGDGEEKREALKEGIFHALRFAFLILAGQHDMYVLHSVSVCYRERAWLFCGSSGTGKSTHGRLWEAEYKTPVLNGDLNCIGFEGEIPVAYGIPWCGTSGIYTTKQYLLGGIAFLSRAEKDEVKSCPEEKKPLSFMQRTISPTWKEDQLRDVLFFAERVSGKVPFYELRCTKKASAARVMKEAVDRDMEIKGC